MGDGDRGGREASAEARAGDAPARKANAAKERPPHWDDPQWLRALLEATPAFLLRADSELRIRYVNQVQNGFTVDDVIGRPTSDFVAPEYQHIEEAAVARAKATGIAQRYTVRAAGPDGTEAFYEALVQAIDNAGDAPQDVALLAVDVTEHVARAEALQASEEQLRLAIEATGLGVWSWNSGTGEVIWNQRMHEITGREQSVSPAEWTSELVHPEDVERVAAEWTWQRAGTHQVSHRIVRPDGDSRWLLLVGQQTSSGTAWVRGGVLDVTEQHVLEDRLREAQRRQSIGTLTAGVAHNFNNMLAVIQPSVELAMRSADADAKRALSAALHAAQRAAQLVTRLMTYAGHRPGGEKTRTRIRTLVDSAVSMCQQTFDRQLTFKVRVDGDPGLVRCNVSEVEQLLMNLLINARDAVVTSPDPEIVITISDVELAPPDAPSGPAKHYARIVITDNGIGMSEQVLARVHEPFFTRKGPIAGTGLGLSMSDTVAREHGGWIALSSREGEGTSAEVYLPSGSDVDAADSPESARSRPASARARVLVVEDEQAVRSVIAAALAESGHEVSTAENAGMAVKLIVSGWAPDVILLDRSMPGWSAARAVEELRQCASAAKILFFTGQQVPVAELSLVDGVVHKPVSIKDLERALADCLTSA